MPFCHHAVLQYVKGTKLWWGGCYCITPAVEVVTSHVTERITSYTSTHLVSCSRILQRVARRSWETTDPAVCEQWLHDLRHNCPILHLCKEGEVSEEVWLITCYFWDVPPGLFPLTDSPMMEEKRLFSEGFSFTYTRLTWMLNNQC